MALQHLHPPLLYQPGTNTAGTKTLRIENILQLHHLMVTSKDLHFQNRNAPLIAERGVAVL